jgi:hypothetical protein
MSGLALLLIGAGGIIAAVNFHLSFVAVPLHKLRRGRAPDRVPSGIPLVGSILLLAGAALAEGKAAVGVALLLFAIDTGGPHWFAGTLLWRAMSK